MPALIKYCCVYTVGYCIICYLFYKIVVLEQLNDSILFASMQNQLKNYSKIH